MIVAVHEGNTGGCAAAPCNLRDLDLSCNMMNSAERFFRKLLKGLQYAPRLLVTDRLGSYGAARRELLPGVAHRQDRRANNRAEVSHQPTRQRERQMRRFKSPRQAQRFFRLMA